MQRHSKTYLENQLLRETLYSTVIVGNALTIQGHTLKAKSLPTTLAIWRPKLDADSANLTATPLIIGSGGKHHESMPKPKPDETCNFFCKQ